MIRKNIARYLPGLRECWLLTGLLMAGGVALPALLSAPLAALFPDFAWLQAINYLLMFLPLLLYVSCRSRCSTLSCGDAGGFPAGIPLDRPHRGCLPLPVLYLLLAVSVPAAAVLVEPLYAWLPAPEWFEQLMESLVGGNLAATLLTVSVLAPLLEEFFCRGLILRGLAAERGPRAAILWSSFIFAVIHLNPWQAIPAFLLGLFFGWVYWRTGSLKATIFLHAVNNTLTVVLSRIYPEQTDLTLKDILPGFLPYPLVWAAALVLFLLVVRLIHNTEKHPLYEREIS